MRHRRARARRWPSPSWDTVRRTGPCRLTRRTPRAASTGRRKRHSPAGWSRATRPAGAEVDDTGVAASTTSTPAPTCRARPVRCTLSRSTPSTAARRPVVCRPATAAEPVVPVRRDERRPRAGLLTSKARTEWILARLRPRHETSASAPSQCGKVQSTRLVGIGDRRRPHRFESASSSCDGCRVQRHPQQGQPVPVAARRTPTREPAAAVPDHPLAPLDTACRTTSKSTPFRRLDGVDDQVRGDVEQGVDVRPDRSPAAAMAMPADRRRPATVGRARCRRHRWRRRPCASQAGIGRCTARSTW